MSSLAAKKVKAKEYPVKLSNVFAEIAEKERPKSLTLFDVIKWKPVTANAGIDEKKFHATTHPNAPSTISPWTPSTTTSTSLQKNWS